jgi:hypothetical protein
LKLDDKEEGINKNAEYPDDEDDDYDVIETEGAILAALNTSEILSFGSLANYAIKFAKPLMNLIEFLTLYQTFQSNVIAIKNLFAFCRIGGEFLNCSMLKEEGSEGLAINNIHLDCCGR